MSGLAKLFLGARQNQLKDKIKDKMVSIIIPCRNEENYISVCLDSLINQEYPKGQLEILVVDGMSEDKTREIVREYSLKYPFVRLLDNQKKTTPFAMNIGVKASNGEAIMIAGAHASYDKHYVAKCEKYLKEYQADNVGGIRTAASQEKTIVTRVVLEVLDSFFGAGSAYYVIGSEKPKEVDTVFGGCYKKEVFDKIGFFNERLTRSQDMDFNLRLKKAGGKIMVFPDIKFYYYPKKSNLVRFFWYNFKNGVWVIYPLKIIKRPLRFRHYAPFFLVFGLASLLFLAIFNFLFFWLFLFALAVYLAASFYFSFKIFIKQKDIRFLLLAPLIFIIRHFGYGLGSLWGILTIWKV